ncbi:rhombosortase [Roseateles sp. BYS180W]|uniref:Rhombosortase n=1 Tax=Roseateles rivi TaxID=3299028 RepID=A0ABW7FT51_9BURK
MLEPRLPPEAAAPAAWGSACALAALGATAVFLAPAGLQAALEWRPELALTQPWRVCSAALVHLSLQHLLANLAGCLMLALLAWRAGLGWRTLAAWALAWPLTQLGLLAWPDLSRYGGLSGVLHAGVATAALALLLGTARPSGAPRTVGALLLLGLALKVALEHPFGPALQTRAGWSIPIAPAAHFTGALAGVLGWAVVCALARWRSRRGGTSR